MGGYRKGSGRSKKGYYKGIYCGSTYELCWVIHALDHNVKFDRFEGCLEKDGIRYFPDFLLDDRKTIIETKGYESSQTVDKKTRVAEHFGYIVKVLRKDDLEYAFSYVESKYNTKKFYELYDGYRPKYTHQCDWCSNKFETDRKIKTENKFCSRQCAGKFRKSKNIMTEDIKQKISESLIGKKPRAYKRRHKQVWITDGTVNTRIKHNDPIPVGFKLGRSKTSL